MKIVVNAFWDEEASVWIAEGETIQGLVTEADNLDTLVSKIRVMIPELIELNGIAGSEDSLDEIPIVLNSTCQFTVKKAC